MALNFGQLLKVFGKSSDDFADAFVDSSGKALKGKARAAKQAEIMSGLQSDFNALGTKAAKWGGIDDFSALSDTDQLSLVQRYNSRMDEFRNMSSSERRALLDEKLGRTTDSNGNVTTKYSEINAQQKADMAKQRELRQISNRKNYREATRPEGIEYKKPRMSSGERASQILNNPNATPEQIAAANRVLDNQDVRLGSGRGNENISSKNRGAAAREAYENQRANREGLTLEERVARNEAGESHSLRTKEMQEKRVADINKKQDAADKALERVRNQAQRAETREASSKAFDEAQEKIDKQNRSLPRRVLGGISEKGQKVISNVKDTLSGATREANATFATDYNRIVRQHGGQASDMIDIGGAGNLRKQFDGKTAQEVYDAQQEAMEDAARKAREHAEWWAGKKDGIVEFAKENQMLTAAGIATAGIGGTMLVTSLLDDDDY